MLARVLRRSCKPRALNQTTGLDILARDLRIPGPAPGRSSGGSCAFDVA